MLAMGVSLCLFAHADETRVRTLAVAKGATERNRQDFEEIPTPTHGTATPFPRKDAEFNLFDYFEPDDVATALRKLDGRELPTLTALVNTFYRHDDDDEGPGNGGTTPSNVVAFPVAPK